MIIRACAFTPNGREKLDVLKSALNNYIVESKDEQTDLHTWIGESFKINAPILFVGAIGIAVRKITPFVKDKLSDSPVIVMDEKAEYVVPILSGHVGGANELSRVIAHVFNAQAVITTSTDVNRQFSVDVFAVKNGFTIMNRDGIKKVSSKIIKEGTITMAVDDAVLFDADDVPDSIKIVNMSEEADVKVLSGTDKVNESNALLTLLAKPYVIGIGCKKDTEDIKLEQFVLEKLESLKADISMVYAIASIDLKKDEHALAYMKTKYRIPLSTFSAEQLERVEGEFSDSEFVKSTTGVGNVCERAALCLAGNGGRLVVKKTARDGMTFAAAEKKAEIITWET